MRCPRCREAVVAQARPAQTGTRLRAVPDLTYGEPSGKPGVVRVQCPGCKAWLEIPGRLVIEAA